MAWQAKWRFTGPLALSVSATKKLLRTALARTGEHWRSRFAAGHFEKSATAKYGYPRRAGDVGFPPKKGSYTWKKLRKFSHIKPLVFTGELKNDVLNKLKGRSRATINRAGDGVIKIPVGRKANLKNPRSRAHPIRELQTLLPSESAELSQFLVNEIDQFLMGAGETARADFGAVGQPTGISRAMLAA